MKKSYVWAAVLAIVVVGWIASGQFGDTKTTEASAVEGKPAVEKKAALLPAVRVRNFEASDRAQELVLLGVTEASRKVTLRAETKGRIVAVPLTEGKSAKRGATIVQLAMDDRRERLAETRARLDQYRIEYSAAKDLAARNFRSKVKLAESQAHLKAAEASLASMELDIQRTTLRAPFDGILESRLVEVGDFVDIGDPLASFIDLSPILVVGEVTDRNIGKVKIGITAQARLVTGARVQGKITRISSVASVSTRTFRVELTVDNSDGALTDGLTAEMRIPSSEARAHMISPALLTLSDSGEVGVKAVDGEGIVLFYPVEIDSDTPEGVWVSGLPDRVRVITVGQEFVRPGQKVRMVPDTARLSEKQVGPKS
ncbi:MAG: efflux RND transporter periplasmic adaptor subunit [Proteobacteria bacterium]|nr:efflux RND transporter periplasmic adaptor subunit [Pseudomonadota bacterium]